MNTHQSHFQDSIAVETSAQADFERMSQAIAVRIDTLFSWLLCAQWLGGILLATILTPRTWSGTISSVHMHIWMSTLLGGVISLPAAWLARKKPGRLMTRQVVTAAQMLTSGLLIDLTGGRLETHFHIFGSLALLAFYRDWRVFPTAVLITTFDHFARGMWLPESIYGVTYASPWRSAEHAAWVLFEVSFLVWSCRIAQRELLEVATKRFELQALNRTIEARVEARTAELLKAKEDIHLREQSMWQLKTILRTAADAIVILDHDWRVTLVNTKAEEIFCYNEAEMVGRGVDLILPGFSLSADQRLASGIDDSTAEGVRYWEIQALTKSGAFITVEVAVSAMAVDGKNMYTIILRDVTRRRIQEVELRHAQKLESIGQLAAGIAHEINTPIQFVSHNTQFFKEEFENLKPLLASCAQLAKAAGKNQSSTEIAAEIARVAREVDVDYLQSEIPVAIEQTLDGVTRVTKIVRAMKDFSHPGSSDKQPIDINRAIESAVIVSTNEWKYVAEVDLRLAQDLPLVPCLPDELNQVILNLLLNGAQAIGERNKATPEIKGRLTIETRLAANSVEIRMSDTGTGIPREIASRIFDPFFTTKEVGRGTGQGLSIARAIVVNKHGGTIDFESEVGKGTTFIVSLPIQASVNASSGAQASL